MKITKPKSFIINRKKWYRGKDSGSMLRRPDDGKKCCLGFYANACGVPSQQITGRYGPEDLPAPLPGVSRRTKIGVRDM